jgi:septal ring factor EnvC (AmiA/AmiB activator)
MPIASAVSPTLLLVLHVALREQLSRTKREHASALEAVAAAAQTAEADKWVRAAKVDDLKDEIERLRRQIHELQQESADKCSTLTSTQVAGRTSAGEQIHCRHVPSAISGPGRNSIWLKV